MKFNHASTELSGCRFSRADISRSSETSEEVQAIESGHPLFLGSRKWVVPSAHFLEASVVVQERAQVLAHEARPRIGRPRQQGQAGGIGSMAYEGMARNCSEKNLNSGKIAATLKPRRTDHTEEEHRPTGADSNH